MTRLLMALFVALGLGIVASTTTMAQADTGNDGLDTNCSFEDFATVEEARAYFFADGGSATRNVDDLDRNGDGIACNSGLSNTAGGPGPGVPVATEPPAVPTTAPEAPVATEAPAAPVATQAPTTGGGGSGVVLPDTGAGMTAGTTSSMAAVLAVLAVISAAVAASVRTRRV